GTTTLQLQLIDLRPSLKPSRHECEALSLLERLRDDEPLTAQEVSRLRTSREQFGAYWKMVEPQLRQGKLEENLLPYLRRLANAGGGTEGFLRAALALAVFDERGLLTSQLDGDRLVLKLRTTQGKVDLFACPYLSRLHDGAAKRN
ncbi:MAG: single-stranded-DNA-specific exonuclease RecJ, partial [Oscillibacter sp.]